MPAENEVSRVERNSIFHNSIVVLIAGFLAGALGYLFHAIMSRNLSISQYGELQSLISLLTIFTVLTNVFSYVGVKYAAVLARDDDVNSGWQLLKALRQRVRQMSGYLIFVYVLVSPILRFYLDYQDMLGLAMVGIAGVIIFLTISDLGVLTGWECFSQISKVSIVGATVKLMAGVALVLISPTASIVIASCLLANITIWGMLRWFSKRRFRGGMHSMKIGQWKAKYFSGINMRMNNVMIIAYSILIALISSVDILVIRHLLPRDVVGYYGALSVLGKIILWGNLAIITVVLPSAVAKGYDRESVSRRVLVGAYSLIIGLSVAIIVVYYLFPSYVVHIFLGDKYTQFSNTLWLFGVMAFILTLLQFEANFAFAKSDWRVLYLLILVLMMMVGGIYLQQNSIEGVVRAIIVSFSLGYIGVLCLNYIKTSHFVATTPSARGSR